MNKIEIIINEIINWIAVILFIPTVIGIIILGTLIPFKLAGATLTNDLYALMQWSLLIVIIGFVSIGISDGYNLKKKIEQKEQDA